MSETAADWIGATRGRLEVALADALDTGLASAPSSLADAMRYAALSGGKRLRPLLVLASCRACRGEESLALPAAVAVELIHAYSLVHDDLPAMDDDDLRRGRPTVHVKFGEATAVLAGDALQSLAFETIGGAALPPERALRQARALALAAGAAGMAGGQQLDLEAAGGDASELSVERIHRLKTGALISVSFVLGAEAAGANRATADALGRIGASVGLAFQIRDDVLDQTASTKRLGKTAGKDLAAGKATWPAAVGIEEARRRADVLAKTAAKELSRFGREGAPLRELVRRAVERES